MDIVDVIKGRALEKLDNFEDCSDEMRYLAMLDQDAYEEVSERYFIIKHTTGYAVKDIRHKLKLLIRGLVA